MIAHILRIKWDSMAIINKDVMFVSCFLLLNFEIESHIAEIVFDSLCKPG